MFDENGKAVHSLQTKAVADMMMKFGGNFIAVVGNKKMVRNKGQAHFFERDGPSWIVVFG